MPDIDSNPEKIPCDDSLELQAFVVDGRFKVIFRVDGPQGGGGQRSPEERDVADALLEEGVSLGGVGEVLEAAEATRDRCDDETWVELGGRAAVVMSARRWADGVRAIALLPRGVERDDSRVAEWRKRFADWMARQRGVLASRRSPRVLVVDDNKISADYARKLLQKLGCKAEAAGSGMEALELCWQLEFDLVLMDVQMSGLDGFNTTRILNGDAALRGQRAPRVVGLTASASAREREAALEAGMEDLLEKPASLAVVRGLLGERLGSRRLFSEPARLKDLPHCALDREAWQGDEALGRRMTSMLARQGEKEVDEIEALAASERLGELERAVHALKGGADVVRAVRLADVCDRVLASLRAGDPDRWRSEVLALRREFAVFRAKAVELGLLDDL